MATPTIETLVKLLFGLAIAAPGSAALVVVLINILKMIGLVKDTQSGLAVNILNVVIAIVLGVLALFFPNVNIGGLDEFLKSLSGTLTAFLPLLAILVKWLAPYFYGAIRGVPLLGYHFKK